MENGKIKISGLTPRQKQLLMYVIQLSSKEEVNSFLKTLGDEDFFHTKSLIEILYMEYDELEMDHEYKLARELLENTGILC
jgi:hypothetical protein